MKSENINLRVILLETFFLVLGVLLALGANNWREHHNNQERAEIARISILEELKSNHAAVTAAIDYHSYLMDTVYKFMRRYGAEEGRLPGTEVFHQGFINPASTLSRAWEAANVTGAIEYMDYDEVLLISQVHKHQEQYETQSRAIGQQIYNRMFESGTRGVLQNYRNHVQIVGSFVYTECSLAKEYAQVIPMLQSDSTAVALPAFCQYIPER